MGIRIYFLYWSILLTMHEVGVSFQVWVVFPQPVPATCHVEKRASLAAIASAGEMLEGNDLSKRGPR